MRQLTQILCALLVALPFGLRPACARASRPALQATAACCATPCCCNSRPGLSRCQTLPGRDGSEADAGQALRTDSVRPTVSFEPSIVSHAALDTHAAGTGPTPAAISDPRASRPEPTLLLICTLQV